MNLAEGKDKFVQAWATLGSSWGINRTMAQIHAFLMVTPDSLSADDIMEALKISRGNANMNLRALMDWGLVYKEYKAGERKEFFYAEKDIWKVAMQVVKERRKRELEPLLNILEDLKKVEADPATPEGKTFLKTIHDIDRVVEKADNTIEMLVKADENWFINNFMKLLKR